MHEIARLSWSVLTSVLHDVVASIGCLYKLAEVVSNVDFLLSLAEACTLSDYVRPEFTDTLCIIEGRHPVLEKVGMRTFIPNDTFASSHHNCNVITGSKHGEFRKSVDVYNHSFTHVHKHNKN
ncbi:hypothetical protein MTO96_014794 [Rhipicephalus appendiculatus]